MLRALLTISRTAVPFGLCPTASAGSGGLTYPTPPEPEFAAPLAAEFSPLKPCAPRTFPAQSALIAAPVTPGPGRSAPAGGNRSGATVARGFVIRAAAPGVCDGGPAWVS